MQQSTDNQPPQIQPSEAPPLVLFEAIARRQQVSAVYNGMETRLAPHILYTREEMLYLGAIVTMRRGEPVQHVKLSIFKVQGLNDLTLLTAPFQVDREFDPSDPRFAATTVFVVER